MNELAARLGQMSLDMQDMMKDSKALKADMILLRNESLSVHVEGRPSSPRRPNLLRPAESASIVPGSSSTALALSADLMCASGGPAISTDVPVSLSNGSRVTKKTILSARAGEYANLADYIPNNEPSNIMETVVDEETSQVVFRQKSTKKTIDSFLTWSQAWAGFEEVILESNFSRYQKCATYRLFIQKHNALYTWTAVTLYDQRFRHMLSMSRSFDFEVVDTNIAFLVFNSLSVRPSHKGCFRCGSIDHHQKTCPFSSGGSLEKAQTTPKKPSKSPYNNSGQSSTTGQGPSSYTYSRNREICFNFNSGKCSDAASCGRRHVCSGCGGPEPFFRCFRCNPAPSHGSVPPQQASMGAPNAIPPR